MRIAVARMWIRVCLLAVGVVIAGPRTVLAQDPVYDGVGAQYGRGYFAPLPFERIDTVTGNLFLSFTDLVLPGNAGFSLSVVRTYNSRDARWHFGIGQAPLNFVYKLPNSDLSDIDFVTADGSKHNAAGGGAMTTTQEYWQFTKSTYTLEMPNGLVATYGYQFGTYGRYLTELRDPFDNVVTFTWDAGTDHLQTISQWVGGSPNHARYVTFNGWADGVAAGMSYDTKAWSYAWQTLSGTPNALSLVWVGLPGGTRWNFSYTNDANNTVKLASLTTPNGAQVSYTWALDTFPSTPAQRVAIKTRAVSGNVPSASWDFDWQNTGRRLVLTGPVNRVTYDTIVQNDIPVGTSRVVAALNGTVLDTETLSYETIPNPDNPIPALKTVTSVRDGRTFTTTYTYATNDFANYGQPTQIVETGELTRTTAITYKHDFGKYIKGRVLSTTVTVGAQSFTTSRTYHATTGFVTSTTAFGITTNYQNDGLGNTGTVIDATNRQTVYSYEWGVVKTVSTAAGTVTRELNHDGTVASETMGGSRTNYGYDVVGRVTSVTDPNGSRVPVTTDYLVTDYRWVGTKVSRGATLWARTDFDGYGRAVHATDSTSIESKTTYDAGGRVTYRSHPYGTGVTEIGTNYTYDALSRPLVVTRPDGSTVTYEYLSTGSRTTESVSSTVSHTQTYTYQGFSLGDQRLVAVKDASNGTWNYTYDAPGNLRTVDTQVSGGALRTWTYNNFNQLTSASQPESGTTNFEYDAAGRLAWTTDARGIAIGYQYDAAGRPIKVEAPGTADDIVTTYDTNGDVVTVSNGLVQTTLGYDSAHRVTSRTDIISNYPFTQSYVYDGLDNLVLATYPISGRSVFYDYTTQSRLFAVRTSVNGGASQTLASGFTYRGDGALTQYTFGNNLVAQIGFDSRLRPTTWQNGPLNITYAYDHVGNVTSITDARTNLAQNINFDASFQYDALDRLTTVTGFGATTFTYNGAGDRLTQGTISFNYNANRQLSSLTGGASGNFTYDPTGSLLTDPSGAAYTYDALGKLKTSTLSSQTTTYGYGPGGSRAVKTGADGLPHLFVYGGGGGPIAEYIGANADVLLQREYVYAGGQLLASFTPATTAPPNMTVALLSPTPNQLVGNGQTVTLTASATAGSGLTLARVEYYVRGVYIGQATTAPYTKTWTNTPLPPGSYLFTARAVSTDNHAVASAPVTITVQ